MVVEHIVFDFKSRRDKLKHILQEKECLLFVPRDEMQKGDDEYFHSIDSMFRYFFSNIKVDCIALVYLENGIIRTKLGVVQRNDREEKFRGKIDLELISSSSAIESQDIMTAQELEAFIISKCKDSSFTMLSYGYDERRRYFSTYKEYISIIKTQAKLNSQYLKNRYDEIAKFRMIKEESEIRAIQRANEYAKEAFEYTLKRVKSSCNEQELFAHLSFSIFNQQSSHAFYPIIASGKNATVLHYSSHNSKLSKEDTKDEQDEKSESELVLFDFGCECEGYKSDISRTVPKSGKFSSRQKEVYEAVLRVQEYAFSQLEIGVRKKMKLKEYEMNVMSVMGQELVKLGVLTQEELGEDIKSVRKYYPHSTSHQLGLDTHDFGSYEDTITKGMVLTVEPGIYIEEENIGIRVEDNVVITKDGIRNISHNILKSVDEIEEFMSKY